MKCRSQMAVDARQLRVPEKKLWVISRADLSLNSSSRFWSVKPGSLLGWPLGACGLCRISGGTSCSRSFTGIPGSSVGAQVTVRGWLALGDWRPLLGAVPALAAGSLLAGLGITIVRPSLADRRKGPAVCRCAAPSPQSRDAAELDRRAPSKQPARLLSSSASLCCAGDASEARRSPALRRPGLCFFAHSHQRGFGSGVSADSVGP
mmetsp:Transcript_21496/g.51288  ORF Transcript_21496/g.51288 Transcript_21496/m.51288 type:complete len:206 (+) Transcript_21496:28-645(+)